MSRYEEWRRPVDDFFARATGPEGPPAAHLSPSGAFSLEVSAYASGPDTWNYSRGVVRRTSDHAVVADIKRNFDWLWHAWVPHRNGHEYLLCGEEYQGYNVIELESGRNRTHFPDEAFDGAGFCWMEVQPSPDGLTLAVTGCYWASPSELVFLDFADPASLPLKELARIGDLRETVGWVDDNTFAYSSVQATSEQAKAWERIRASG